MKTTVHRFKCLLAAGVVALGATAAIADTTKPITLVVPYTPGGTTDILARTIATHMSEGLGTNVVVDNRPGSGTIIGAQVVARAPGDGKTLLMATSTTLAINPALYKSIPYTPTDFVPVGLVAKIPLVIVVPPTLQVNTLQDLVRLAKEKPDFLSFGSAGNGSPQHLAAEMFKSAAGVSMVHVPYRGTSAALADLLTGRVGVLFSDLAPVIPHIRAGSLRALAVTTSERLSSLPDVPTVSESRVAGTSGYEAVAWQSVVASPGTPPDVVRPYSEELSKILSRTDVKDKLRAEGVYVQSSTPEELAAYLKTEMSRWAEVVKTSGASVD